MGSKKLEWWCYRAEQEVWQYHQPSGYNTSAAVLGGWGTPFKCVARSMPVLNLLTSQKSVFHPQGRLPWPISKICRGFYTHYYPTLVFQISCDLSHSLQSYCWETARRSIRPNFSVHPVGKTMHWIQKWIHLFDAHNELYHHARSYNAHRL